MDRSGTELLHYFINSVKHNLKVAAAGFSRAFRHVGDGHIKRRQHLLVDLCANCAFGDSQIVVG